MLNSTHSLTHPSLNVFWVVCLSADYSMLLSIVDESLTNSLDRLKCMLFARDIHSLPDANVGDVIRLHRLKVNARRCCNINILCIVT